MEKCKDIEFLNLTRIPKFTEKGLTAIAEGGLNNLKYLNLYANSSIEDIGFQALAKASINMSKMQFLDFCGCKLLMDDSVIEMSRNFVNLKYFNLTWCLNLSDRSIVEGVSKYLNKLNLLSVYGLVKITDKSIKSLIENESLRNELITLDINGCKEITMCSDHQSIVNLFPNVRVTVFHS